MRKTLEEVLAMGRQGFLDAMLAELESKLRRPGLTPDDQERLEQEIADAKAQLAARQDGQAAASRAA